MKVLALSITRSPNGPSVVNPANFANVDSGTSRFGSLWTGYLDCFSMSSRYLDLDRVSTIFKVSEVSSSFRVQSSLLVSYPMRLPPVHSVAEEKLVF